MNLFFHHVAERLINHLMSLQRALSFKMRGYDRDSKMSAAAFSAFVSGMAMAVIANLDFPGLKGIAQAGFDEAASVHAGVF